MQWILRYCYYDVKIRINVTSTPFLETKTKSLSNLSANYESYIFKCLNKFLNHNIKNINLDTVLKKNILLRKLLIIFGYCRINFKFCVDEYLGLLNLKNHFWIVLLYLMYLCWKKTCYNFFLSDTKQTYFKQFGPSVKNVEFCGNLYFFRDVCNTQLHFIMKFLSIKLRNDELITC